MHQSISLLSEYIRVNTVNPPGNESAAADFLANILAGEGIDYQFYESVPNRKSIRAVLPGNGKKGRLILLHHMDVVAAKKEEWSFDPFSGEITDDYILGRGTLDTKGLGIMQLLAFIEMKKRNIPLNRDLVYLATADEEAGGKHGVEYLLDRHFDDLKADLVLNEGGLGEIDPDRQRPLLMISTAEKGPCWLKLIRRGKPGHGSMPHNDNALENLVKAVNRLLAHEEELQVTPSAAAYFKNLADDLVALKPYQIDGQDSTLINILQAEGMLKQPAISSKLKNSISLNRIVSGEKTNIIPSYAEAELDIRLLPGVKVLDFIAKVKQILNDDEIEIVPLQTTESTQSDVETEYYGTIASTLEKHYPEATITPCLTTGTTDSRFFRNKGIPAFGIAPVVIDSEHIKSIHGIDEKISRENMIKGTEIYIDLVQRFCGD